MSFASLWRQRGMFRKDNIFRQARRPPHIAAAAALAASVLILTAATPTFAQESAPAADAASLQAPLLDRSHARQAHRLAESWIRSGEVGEPLPAPLEVTDLFAVRVTLRIAGHTVGIGDAVRSDAAAAVDGVGPSIDAVPLIAQATGRALADLSERLKDVRMRAVIDGRVDSSRPAPTPADVGTRVLVDVQLARHPQTIRIPVDAPPSAVFGTFAGGFHGLRVVRPGEGHDSRPGALMWPASAIAANTAPDSQLVQLLRSEGYRHDQVIELGRPLRGAPAFQRFDIIHIVRPQPGLPVMELVRGNVVLPPLSVSSRTLNSLGDQLAAHLAGRFVKDGGLRGTYHPTSDRYNPLFASDEDIAIACYALTRHSRLIRAANPQAPAALQDAYLAYDTAVRLANSSMAQTPVELSPAAAAYLLLTLADANLPDRADARLRDDLTRWLLSLRNEQGRFRATSDPDAEPLNETRAAVVAAGLAAVYQQTRAPQLAEAIGRLLDQLWQAAEANPNPAALPWIVVAHTRAQRLIAADDPAAVEQLNRRERVLGNLVDRLGRQQVIEPPLLGPPDVVGGFQLHAGPVGSPPNPDWRTAHLLSFLALCLADDAIAQPHNRFDWAITAGLAARFIGQLMVDEPACFYMRNPDAAMRGVRLALWNNELAVGPTAVSLLAVTQLREATDSLRSAVESP